MRIRKQHSQPTAPLLDAAEASLDQRRGRARDHHRRDADLQGAFIPRQVTNLA